MSTRAANVATAAVTAAAPPSMGLALPATRGLSSPSPTCQLGAWVGQLGGGGKTVREGREKRRESRREEREMGIGGWWWMRKAAMLGDEVWWERGVVFRRCVM